MAHRMNRSTTILSNKNLQGFGKPRIIVERNRPKVDKGGIVEEDIPSFALALLCLKNCYKGRVEILQTTRAFFAIPP